LSPHRVVDNIRSTNATSTTTGDLWIISDVVEAHLARSRLAASDVLSRSSCVPHAVRDELVTGLESDRDWRELLTLEVKIIIATNATNLLVISELFSVDLTTVLMHVQTRAEDNIVVDQGIDLFGWGQTASLFLTARRSQLSN
jgi:hypothetical protein